MCRVAIHIQLIVGKVSEVGERIKVLSLSLFVGVVELGQAGGLHGVIRWF